MLSYYKEKDNTIKIKTLSGIISVNISSYDNNVINGNDIKKLLISNTCLMVDDILLIKDGKEVKNDDIISLELRLNSLHTSNNTINNNNTDNDDNDDNNNDTNNNNNDTNNISKINKSLIFAIIRSTANSKTDVIIKNKQDNKSYTLSYQVNMKIFQLRKEISKVTGIRQPALRMIIGCRILKDEGIIGDYILSTVKKNKQCIENIVIQVSRTIDVTQDVDIKVHFPNRSIIEFSMEVGVPISTARQILSRSYYMPLDVPLEIYLDKKYLTKLDYTRSLIDYGICPTPGKKICVELYIKVNNGNNRNTSLNPFEEMLDGLISDITSTMKKSKSTKSKSSEAKSRTKTATATANTIISDSNQSIITATVTETPQTSIGTSKKPSRGGLFSSMKRGFLSHSKKDNSKKENDNDCIITKDDNTPMKIKKMSNVTKQVLLSEKVTNSNSNTLLFDETGDIKDSQSTL